MKEALIAFIICLIIGSILNGIKQDSTNSEIFASGEAGGISSPLLVDDASFQREVLDSPTPVLVNFYADSCPSCRKMAPVITQIASDMKGTLKVVRVDAMASQALAQRYAVEATPNFLVFREGHIVDSAVGAMPKEDLLSMIRKHTEPQEGLPAGSGTSKG